MLGDNIVAFDCLVGEKSSVRDLSSAVVETSNQNLRQSFIQMRNQAEQDQDEIYHIAEQNGWYLAAGRANPQEISRFWDFFQQSYQTAQQTGSIQRQPGGLQYQTAGQGMNPGQMTQPQGQAQYKPSSQYPKY